jgi:hypothetical protein
MEARSGKEGRREFIQVLRLCVPRDNQDENAATIKVRNDACWNGVGRSP